MDKAEMIRLVKEDFLQCESLFVALGEGVRQEIILHLIDAECEGLNVGSITERTHLSRPAVSHHLKILKDAGIVYVRCVGTMNYYVINGDGGLCKIFAMGKKLDELVKVIKTDKLHAKEERAQ